MASRWNMDNDSALEFSGEDNGGEIKRPRKSYIYTDWPDTFSVHYEGRVQTDPRRLTVFRVEVPMDDSRPRYEQMWPGGETSFSWGDMNISGQFRLSDALIMDATENPDLAEKYQQSFRTAFIKSWTGNWRIDRDQIRRWIKAREYQARLVKLYQEDMENDDIRN